MSLLTPTPPAGANDEGVGQRPPGVVKPRGRGKRKKLKMIAVKCEERQWPDYREAVYPLLLKFGFFDPLPEDRPAQNRSAGKRPAAGFPLPDDHRGKGVTDR